MMSPLAAVIAKSGILDAETMQEFRRWGVGIPEDDEPLEKPSSAQELVSRLEMALQSEGLVLERVTDLEILPMFIASQEMGTLHVVIGSEEADFEIPFGRTAIGGYILPWKGENVADELCNGLTYLTPHADQTQKIFFQDIREMFYGVWKAFIICTPSGPVPSGNNS